MRYRELYRLIQNCSNEQEYKKVLESRIQNPGSEGELMAIGAIKDLSREEALELVKKF